MKEFWNQRYGETGLAYGPEPNRFVREYLDGKEPGRILFPCEGQGRNAIYAARLGWQVDAFDYSEVAQQTALGQASAAGVAINYNVQDILEYNAEPGIYDIVFLCYVHLKPEWRESVYPELIKGLKSRGELVMEAFTKTQLAYQSISGGPANESLLYTPEIVRKDFENLHEVYLEEFKTELNEGKYHVGPAHVLRYIGRKETP